MRVLLVHSNRERLPQPAIPLGLCLVASSLEPAGYQPRLLDLCFSPRPIPDLDRALADFRPDAIGLSLRNLDNGDYLRPRSYLLELAALAQHLRSRSRSPLIIGGPAVSILPLELLSLLPADYAIIGDGEQALPALLEAIATGADASALPGVCPRGQGSPQFVSTAQVSDVETLPFAQIGRWLDLNPYLRGGSPLPIQTKRGCQLKCVYCTYRHIEGRHYRLRSPHSVVAEMDEAQRRWRVRSFEIVDSTFNHPLDHALALCQAIVQARLRADFQTTGLTPAATAPALLQLMKRAGFANVVCTPDSGSERILATLKKGFGPEEVARTAAWAREADLPILWSFVFGAPGENNQTVRATLRFMNTVFGPRDRFICTLGLRIYPGTELAALATGEGALAPEANLIYPTFYFSPHITPTRVLSLLDASPVRSRMICLSSLQSPLVALALRLRRALHLPGPPWAYLPVYNKLARLGLRRTSGVKPDSHRER